MSVSIRETVVETTPAGLQAFLFCSASFPEEETIDKLQANRAKIARLVYAEIDSVVAHLVECVSVEEFRYLRKKVLPPYFKLSLAMSNLVQSTMIDERDHAAIVQEGLTRLEQKFQAEGSLYLGADVNQEAIFSISTLKRAYRWLPRMLSRELPQERVEDDKELAGNFAEYVLYSQFHLDCLRFALRHHKTIASEVSTEILEGLRSSLMAYTCVRRGLELRGFLDHKTTELENLEWDDEDEMLANL